MQPCRRALGVRLPDHGWPRNLTYISIYGTTCASWDQMPGTPQSDYCTNNADWCHSHYNWCQLPWCFVGEGCSSRLAMDGFGGSSAAFYSYDTCLSTPDCRNMPYDASCPFDSHDTNWPTASDCRLGWTDTCHCTFQGGILPSEVYMNYPLDEPGKYAKLANIAVYGTSCAAWDSVPSTPMASMCAMGSDWSTASHNWCQVPWCYVDAGCASAIESTVFNGSTVLHYSYDVCGNAPDCYNNFAVDPRCPYDPSGDGTFGVHKGQGCECTFQGAELPWQVYMNYPSDHPGRYVNLTYISIYGTTCASWDQMPGTPQADYCTNNADWCHSHYNWCQLPWCFVGEGCSSRLAMDGFGGSSAAFYSYDTCLSTPDCRNMPYDASCPFDSHDTNWPTASDCRLGLTDTCHCTFQGGILPSEVYMNYPLDEPGKYAKLANIAVYGTSCAAWDSVPSTPMASMCAMGSDWSTASHNWCQVPWCYVDAGCASAIESTVFNGSTVLHYSYDVCGNAPDCYNNFAGDPRCPYDPSGDGTFGVHKGQGCECTFQGAELPWQVYMNYPSDHPGRYVNLTYISIYGTTCASWDQMPGTPQSDYCTNNADWCHSHYNWCQLPWCFVGEGCSSRLAMDGFGGSSAAFYSYDTCLSTPDCRNMPYDASCPFDSHDTNWPTAEECPNSWSDVCECEFQGSMLPSAMYMNFPEEEPGRYAQMPNVGVYGTTCAAWDQVPGMPFASRCAPGSDWSHPDFNWCQLPWCYVGSSCPSRIPTRAFNGSMAYYSYDSCGNAPDCYHHFGDDSRCPYDPYSSKNYKIHKSDGCECVFQGRELPDEVFFLDMSDEGDTSEVFSNMTYGRIYGTTCAAWDQMPGSPWAVYCPRHADWCHTEHNWCQLPWCYVSEDCPTKLNSTVFSNASATYYSYDTCLSTPDCRTMPYDASCPFDYHDTNWPTAEECPNSWTDVCECEYQGSMLPQSWFMHFPAAEPGKFAHLANIAVYGTTCATWDQIPGTPLSSRCAPGSDWSHPDFNWCQLPWCYVAPHCPSRIPTRVFNGSKAYYSYDSCGNAPDCYSQFHHDLRCPYDPYDSNAYRIHKNGACDCLFHGVVLPQAMYSLHPIKEPGKYANLTHISIYGSTCAAWDQMPGSPWAEYCPRDADWCHSQHNWCQQPWCYVSEACPTRLSSTVFNAASTKYYSYDTCLSTPDCRNMPYEASCPFDSHDTNWPTAEECPNSWSDVCECEFQGSMLPSAMYMNFPVEEPGRYAQMPNVGVYGTTCAAWDQVPGMPFASRCAPGSDWSHPDFNWCQLPWCYVGSSCPSRIPTRAFNGSMAYYSYDSCGNAPDCYHHFGDDSRCPYDPYSSKNYKIHKSDGCDCLFHGSLLPAEVYDLYPSNEPGKYANLTHISIYGSTCAAWDQMPGSPWAEYCPRDADWCHSQHNWCQQPWCYVSEACPTRLSSTVFNAASTKYYSYDTCLSTPDCRNMPYEASCPFDSHDTNWPTAEECPNSWSDVCECEFQGSMLPSAMYMNFPVEEPGRYAQMPNVGVYGTTCAAWDQVPGMPFASRCAPGSDWSHPDFNWCQLPWCYVGSSCPSRIPTRAFNGSMAYYSYDSCGNAPDCYHHFGDDSRCPYDPYSSKNYKIHKSDGCDCLFHGSLLPAEVYDLYPSNEPGKYANLTHISIYGSTCAAWDQMPGSPWAEYCPRDADWCHSQYNWCQLPWCFVGEHCSSRVASTIFNGSRVAYRSYDTCLSTPDCSSMPFEDMCPFDWMHSAWSTSHRCPFDWSDVCECTYQGTMLPSELISNFPLEFPGRFKDYRNIAPLMISF